MRLFVATAIVALCSISGIFAQNTTENFIETSVRVSKEVTPDEIYLGITITEKDNKGKISVEQQEKEMIASLKALGIDVKEALTVNNMGSTLKTGTFRKDNIYASREYTLKVTSASLAGSTIEALNNLKIARVGISRIEISDSLEREVKNSLLTEAAQKAQENASILAQAVGSKAGKAIYMQNYYSFDSSANGRVMMKSFATAQNADAALIEEESVELEVSKKTLSINVVCRFAIE